MEFSEVVRRRRMVRNYSAEPVDAAALTRVLDNARRAPSAGHTQGWAFLVLDEPAQVRLFWEVTAGERLRQPDAWLRGMSRAPVVVVPMSSKDAYLERYAEPDKGWTDRSEDRWPVPYWDLDAAMASMLMLLTAVDEGLGACFFGIPGGAVRPLREAFGVPETHHPVGAVTLGHRGETPGARGSAGRGRRPLEEVVHRGRWRSDPGGSISN